MSIESMKKVRGEMEAVLHLLEGAVGRLDDVVTEAGLSAHGQGTLGLGGEGGSRQDAGAPSLGDEAGLAHLKEIIEEETRLEEAGREDDGPVGAKELEAENKQLKTVISRAYAECRNGEWGTGRGILERALGEGMEEVRSLAQTIRDLETDVGRVRDERDKEKGLATDALKQTMEALSAKQALETTISRALDQLVKPGDAQGILMGAIHILKGGAEAGGENLYAGQCEHGVPIGQGCEACGRVIGGQGECRQDAGGPSEDETKTKR